MAKQFKGYCPNCGAKLQTLYAANGTMVMICPHVKAHIVDSGIGMLKHLEIYCNPSQTTQPIKSTAIYEHKKEAAYATELKALHEAFKSLTDGKITLEDLRKATNNTVNDKALLQYANIAIMLDLPFEDLPTLFNAAMKLGFAMDISTEKAVYSLCVGVGRQSRLVLDNIGIVFKAKDAYQWFAKKYGSDALEQQGAVKAWKAYAIKLIMEKAEKLNVKAESKIRLERQYAKLENAKKIIGNLVIQQ